MRHTVTTTIDIEAAPELVWQELADLAGHADWNPFIVQATGQLEPGGRLDIQLRPPDGKGMRFRPTVTVLDEGRTLEWLGRLGIPGLFDGRHRFELHATATGTRLVHQEQFSGIFVRAARRSLDGSTRAGFELMNEALRARVLQRSVASA